MARAAVEQAAGVETKGIRLKNVVWLRPLAVGAEPVAVNIGLYPEANGAIAYQIYSDAGTEQIYSQGSTELGTLGEAGSLDLEAIQKRCQTRLEAGEIYERFKGVGLVYGPGQQGIEELYTGTGEVLAKLRIPASIALTREQFVLHPSIMDGALQATIGLMPSTGNNGRLSLPFALQELEIWEKNADRMWAYLRTSEASGDKVLKLDIDLSDETGKITAGSRDMPQED